MADLAVAEAAAREEVFYTIWEQTTTLAVRGDCTRLHEMTRDCTTPGAVTFVKAIPPPYSLSPPLPIPPSTPLTPRETTLAVRRSWASPRFGEIRRN